MPRVRLTVLSRALVLVPVLAAGLPAARAEAQMPGSVRVVGEEAPIRRWFRQPVTDVLRIVEPGTTLEVLDQEAGWYWVIVPPDAYGTRRAGWIDARAVEPVVVDRRAGSTRESTVAAASPGDAPSDAAEDKVAITASRDEAAAAGAPAEATVYTFEDVHFDRDRHAIRTEDRDTLRGVVAALKADPSLTVTIEGYACSLGTPAYNLALSGRRADAVKAYLASEGVAPERLRTVSFGEEHAKHDNSSEETRRLNRRVALVPDARP